MITRRSSGAIIFRKENNNIYYLLLEYPSNKRNKKDYWGFAKGTMEKGEKEIDTAKREIEEETGINDLKFIKGFKEVISYFFKDKNETIFKTVSYFLAKTETKDVVLSNEHIGFLWLPFEKAFKKLTFDNTKKILEKAHKFLINKNFF
jgi:8-oxo-dGTP pyrophosphatase MutT (NUDIX family)